MKFGNKLGIINNIFIYSNRVIFTSYYSYVDIRRKLVLAYDGTNI